MNKNHLFNFFNFIALPRRFGILKRPDKKKLTPPPLPFMFWLRRFMIETSKYYHVRMHIQLYPLISENNLSQIHHKVAVYNCSRGFCWKKAFNSYEVHLLVMGSHCIITYIYISERCWKDFTLHRTSIDIKISRLNRLKQFLESS